MIVLMMSGTGWVPLSIRYSVGFSFQGSLWRAILTCTGWYCRPSFLVDTFPVTHSHGVLRVFSDCDSESEASHCLRRLFLDDLRVETSPYCKMLELYEWTGLDSKQAFLKLYSKDIEAQTWKPLSV